LAKRFRALVLQPEHRFYGQSLPFGADSFTKEHLELMNTQQALADAAHLIRSKQAELNCTKRGTPGYCPVHVIGGSYPGFLAAMMRLRYPAVVDSAHAASAPTRFYSQEVDQYAYYARVTESAERALQGCKQAVLRAFTSMEAFMVNATVDDITGRFSVCSPLPASRIHDKDKLADDLVFLAMQTFANLNMANYPPGNSTGLFAACERFVATKHSEEALLDAMRTLLLTQTQASAAMLGSGRAHIKPQPPIAAGEAGCFDLAKQLPAGAEATARCGDWSGCGTGRDGEMWDYQTCTFEVERIGFGSPAQMFPPRPWTADWLRSHCERRFGVIPQPLALAELWGFTAEEMRAQGSRIVFTNGLNDGWSVGGIQESLAPEKGLVTINLPNGAHHSELSHSYDPAADTDDVRAAHDRIAELLQAWLEEVRADGAASYV